MVKQWFQDVSSQHFGWANWKGSIQGSEALNSHLEPGWVPWVPALPGGRLRQGCLWETIGSTYRTSWMSWMGYELTMATMVYDYTDLYRSIQ